MAPFKSLGAAAVAVLARQAAIKLVKSQLQAQGERVPLSALHVRVDAYLRDHPELVEQAMARLWQWSVDAERARLDATLFDDDRRVWRKPSRRRPIAPSDNAKRRAEIIGEKVQLVGD